MENGGLQLSMDRFDPGTIVKDVAFLEKAESLKPSLIHEFIEAEIDNPVFDHKNELTVDFKNHYVGYLSFCLEQASGKHQDSPVLLEISFFEHRKEFNENPKKYHGWISSSWIQTEQVFIDHMPQEYRFERRHSFRYVRFRYLNGPKNISLRLTKAGIDSISCADDKRLSVYEGNEEDRKMDAVGLRTLHECMQVVFEDGPKRDQRLWLGDLRLQALANYVTYRQNDLVKRCLYLFAGSRYSSGLVSCNLFTEPYPEADDQYIFDYSLFFINVLWDYYKETGDRETLLELEPVARRQYEILKDFFDQRHLIDPKKLTSCFVDWQKLLDKQTSAQGIFIYAAKALLEMETTLGKDGKDIAEDISLKTNAAREYLFDRKKGVFISGRFRQVSYASQIWMILAGVVSKQEGRDILERIEKNSRAVGMVTPYMYHHYIQALIDCGEKEKAHKKMALYWVAMIEDGADTFYEIFDPSHPNASPYGGNIIHSFCHAWSCTPTYFLRKYYQNGSFQQQIDTDPL